MSFIEEHCADCEELLGNPWREVHEFLDQYAGVFPIEFFSSYHRSFLHNSYGLAIVRARWGEEAHKAAIIHLVADYRESAIRITWEFAESVIESSLRYMNRFDGFDPQIPQPVMLGWKGKGLVAIAKEEI